MFMRSEESDIFGEFFLIYNIHFVGRKMNLEHGTVGMCRQECEHQSAFKVQ